MIGIRSTKRKKVKEEAEKPFWISFSDLMTALMVLFLLAMAVAFTQVARQMMAIKEAKITIKKEQDEIKDLKKLQTKKEDEIKREKSINACLSDVNIITSEPEFRGITLHDKLIDFGTLVTFDENKHDFMKENKTQQEHLIRTFVPRVLEIARSVKCKDWLKRVVVEGFASQTGEYLYNLNLSYLRSQRVLCVLLNSKAIDAISEKDREYIQRLFLVGGSSFNTTANTESQMRRVELKLEFREIGSATEKPVSNPLDPGLTCPNDLR